MIGLTTSYLLMLVEILNAFYRHQAGQLFSQQVVNIPTLALEASGPQLICAYDCYSTVVSGSDEMISSSSQARGETLMLHSC